MINQYSESFWQSQFDTLAAWLDQIERAKQELGPARTTKPNSQTEE